MRKKLMILALISLLTACSTVPFSGRSRLNIVPDDMMLSMSFTNYTDFLKENPPLSANDPATIQIRRIGNKISNAISSYMKTNNQEDLIKNFAWEFNVVKSNEVNAWCMPGGKVVFYTGILPITKDDNGIAVVMGHEIAHAIAKHGNERMSQQLLISMGGMALATALEKKPEETKNLFLTAFGVGSTLGTLAYSRNHEYEADRMGMIFMAMAGYNPNSAVEFWQRMSANGGSGVPEFLSTHPSDQNRINELKKLIPEAMKYYKPS